MPVLLANPVAEGAAPSGFIAVIEAFEKILDLSQIEKWKSSAGILLIISFIVLK